MRRWWIAWAIAGVWVAGLAGVAAWRHSTPYLIAQVKRVIEAMDERGAWVEEGSLKHDDSDNPARRIVDCRTFVANLGVLSDYLATAAD